MPSIAIVGAGIAGIVCAHVCAAIAPHARITVYERGRTEGGRLVAAVPSGEAPFPLGALRLHASKTPRTAALLRELEVPCRPWPYTLRRIDLRRTGAVADAYRWTRRASGARPLHLLAEANDLGRRVADDLDPRRLHRPIAAALADAPASIRRHLVAASGYDCAGIVPARDALAILFEMPERAPFGWLMPHGGFAAAHRTLLETLPEGASVLALREVRRIDVRRGAFRLEIAGPSGSVTARHDRLLLALGKHELGRIGGDLGAPVRAIDAALVGIPKFRLWLSGPLVGADRLRALDRTVTITDAVIRKAYVDGDRIMIYNDCRNADLLGRLGAAAPDVLCETVCAHLRDVLDAPDIIPQHVRAMHWRHWPAGIQLLGRPAGGDVRSALPPGCGLVNEAFSSRHGFVEGVLESALEQCRRVLGTDATHPAAARVPRAVMAALRYAGHA